MQSSGDLKKLNVCWNDVHRLPSAVTFCFKMPYVSIFTCIRPLRNDLIHYYESAAVVDFITVSGLLHFAVQMLD